MTQQFKFQFLNHFINIKAKEDVEILDLQNILREKMIEIHTSGLTLAKYEMTLTKSAAYVIYLFHHSEVLFIFL